MKTTAFFISIFLLIPFSHAKIRTVVLDPAGGGTSHGTKSRVLVEKSSSLRFATLLAKELSRQRLDAVLTRFDDYPTTPEDRIASANQEKDAAVISLHVAPVLGANTITIYTLASTYSTRKESAFFIPLEKVHNPWVRRSELMAQTLLSYFPPDLDIKHISLPFHTQSLLGLNHPAIMMECGINSEDISSQDLENLLKDWSERIAIGMKSFTKKERKL